MCWEAEESRVRGRHKGRDGQTVGDRGNGGDIQRDRQPETRQKEKRKTVRDSEETDGKSGKQSGGQKDRGQAGIHSCLDQQLPFPPLFNSLLLSPPTLSPIALLSPLDPSHTAAAAEASSAWTTTLPGSHQSLPGALRIRSLLALATSASPVSTLAITQLGPHYTKRSFLETKLLDQPWKGFSAHPTPVWDGAHFNGFSPTCLNLW